MTQHERADELLALREDLYEMHFHQVDRKWLIEAMVDFAKQLPQQEISDEMSKIEKALYHAWSDYEYKEGNLYSTTFIDGWLMGINWYREQLKQKK
jgi:hypothetical protein